MDKYVFSGSLTDEMHDLLLAMPDFEPLDILVSQLDRSAIKKTIQWKHEGFCRWLFIDSGAFSIHTGNANTTVDEYIEFLNSIDDDIDVFAQLDTIPGKFGQPKSPEDYELSAQKSWENFLYMYDRVKSPHKLMPVFHFGEKISNLQNMLNWRDPEGHLLDYIGLSPANDVNVEAKNRYLQTCADTIKNSINPNVKTHLYGYTSLEGLSLLPCYSADSISHRLIAGYAKILSSHFGVISLSLRPKASKNKSSRSFLDLADDYNINVLKKELEDLGFTLEEVQQSPSIRVVITMHNIQKLIKTKYKYSDSKIKQPMRLFDIESI